MSFFDFPLPEAELMCVGQWKNKGEELGNLGSSLSLLCGQDWEITSIKQAILILTAKVWGWTISPILL